MNELLITVLDIMNSEIDDNTGSITMQLGDAINKRVESNDANHWQQIGFVSRPANVLDNATDAPQALKISDNDNDIVFATRDVRGQKLYRTISAGETCLYASGATGLGQALVYLKNDSSINLYTVSNDGKTERKGMSIFMRPSEDSITISNSRGYGIRIDENGVFIIGKSGNAVMIGEDTRLGNTVAGNMNCENLSFNNISGKAMLSAPIITVGTGTSASNGAAGPVAPSPILLTPSVI